MQALSFTSPAISTDAVFTRSIAARGQGSSDEFDAWRSMLAETLDLPPPSESAETFEAGFFCWTFGDVVFTRALHTNAAGLRCSRRHRSFPDYWCVAVVRSSSGRRDSAAKANPRRERLNLRLSARPFDGQTETMEVLALFLPRDFCRDELDNLEPAHDVDINPELGALLAGYMDHLARQLPRISPEHAQGLAAATRSLVAACIVPSLATSDVVEAPLASLLIDRARLVVRQNMASPEFGPAQLARLMAMSRSKLYRYFEGAGGVAHFINRERLREAHRRLNSLRDALSIHVIGNEVGFTDHSTFSRAFRREFGYSPTEARERSLARFSAQPLDLVLSNAVPEGASLRTGTSGIEGDGPAPT